jgi:hypothetical protein
MRRPELHEAQILAWADAHKRRTSRWPRATTGRIVGRLRSGTILDSLGEKWMNVDRALRRGNRGLPGGSSLARLLARERGVRNHYDLPRLTIRQVLGWADLHFSRHGQWPTTNSGPIDDAPGETWMAVNAALEQGGRGLPGDSSLARLLKRHRGVRNIQDLRALTIRGILRWADAHHRTTGQWPTYNSGAIVGARGETWMAVHMALSQGNRGLPPGSSLARLLNEHRGVRHSKLLPPLTQEQVLAWADAHHEQTGRWPRRGDGPIAGTDGETWHAVESALVNGGRGLPGGSSLAQLLSEARGVRNIHRLPDLTVPQVLAWADSHHARTGRWPIAKSGPIPEAPGEPWHGVDNALARGRRGLPGGSSLPRLLQEHRGARNLKDLPRWTFRRIQELARAHYQRTGKWPTCSSGPVADAPGETWQAIDTALRVGVRGLARGSSLRHVLARLRRTS